MEIRLCDPVTAGHPFLSLGAMLGCGREIAFFIGDEKGLLLGLKVHLYRGYVEENKEIDYKK